MLNYVGLVKQTIRESCRHRISRISLSIFIKDIIYILGSSNIWDVLTAAQTAREVLQLNFFALNPKTF